MENLLVQARYINLGEAAVNALIGFAVVFLGIGILIFVVWLFGLAFNKFLKKKPEKTEDIALETPAGEEDEIAAVIAAAIAAYYGEKKRKPEFKVKDIKRI